MIHTMLHFGYYFAQNYVVNLKEYFRFLEYDNEIFVFHFLSQLSLLINQVDLGGCSD